MINPLNDLMGSLVGERVMDVSLEKKIPLAFENKL